MLHPPSPEDISLEPRLAGMEDNPVFALMRLLRRATPTPTPVRLTPQHWSDLADAGYPPEDAACGLWGASLFTVWDLFPPLLGMPLLAVAFLWVPRNPSGLPGYLLLPGLAFLTAYLPAARWGNPWGALIAARRDGRRYFASIRGLVPADRRERSILWEAQEESMMGCFLIPSILGLLFFGAPLVAFLPFAELDRFVAMLADWIPRVGVPLAVVVGWMAGRRSAALDFASREDRFALLVMHVRGRMDAGRIATHGHDATIFDFEIDAELGVVEGPPASSTQGNEAAGSPKP